MEELVPKRFMWNTERERFKGKKKVVVFWSTYWQQWSMVYIFDSGTEKCYNPKFLSVFFFSLYFFYSNKKLVFKYQNKLLLIFFFSILQKALILNTHLKTITTLWLNIKLCLWVFSKVAPNYALKFSLNSEIPYLTKRYDILNVKT